MGPPPALAVRWLDRGVRSASGPSPGGFIKSHKKSAIEEQLKSYLPSCPEVRSLGRRLAPPNLPIEIARNHSPSAPLASLAVCPDAPEEPRFEEGHNRERTDQRQIVTPPQEM